MQLPNSPAWKQFTAAAHDASRRGEQLRIINAPGLRLDLSAQAQSPALAQASDALLAQQDSRTRARLFDGGNANWTEQRPAWHTALRAGTPPAVVANAVLTERERVRQFVSAADAAGRYSSVLHLGIGGSDWGPRLITRALRHGGARREVRFASNVDSHSVADAMSRLDPHDTLVIVASKSFTTTEPLANAEVAMNWLRDAGVADPIKQVVAITANVEAALNLGISPISSRSGTGWAAIHCGRPSACPWRWRWAMTPSTSCWPAPPPWTNISATRPPPKTRRCSWRSPAW